MSRIRRRPTFEGGFAAPKRSVPTIASRAIPIPVVAAAPVVQPKAVIQQLPKIALQVPQQPLIEPKTNIPQVAMPAIPAMATASPALPPIMAKFVQTQPAATSGGGGMPEQTQPADTEDTGPTIFNDQYETAEGDEREEDGEIMDNDSGFNADAPIVASHISDGVFRTVAIMHTPMGCFPITSALPVKGAQNGFVNMNGDVFKRAIRGAKRVILSKKATIGKELAAENLVNRSRQGDQNAMATIAAVRENAKDGDPNARHSFVILRNYIENHPAESDIGAEEKQRNHVMSTALMLANGPPITNQRMKRFVTSFGSEARTAHFAVINSAKKPRRTNDAIRQSALDMGRAMGIAQRLQSVRMPGASITKFDPRIGWELGE